jgi:NADPH-dependent 2,4-dienoyl-CoA reductase/sulfur reductase-like enzyme
MEGKMTTLPTETPASDPDSAVDHDVVIVGGGAAGLSAAVFTARYGLDTVVCDGGKAAITQCAHIENYLGFPGGVSPERFLALGRRQAEYEGASVVEERVTGVSRYDGGRGFVIETTDREAVATRVVVAAAYDGDVLEPLGDALSDPDPFAPTESGRTAIDGLYVAGWMSDETVHQVGVSVGHGTRVGLMLARDDMSERYWPEVGERYVDWVVYEGRYGGDGWDEHIDGWFEEEMLPDDHDIDPDLVDRARDDLASEFLGREIDEEERRQRDRTGQRRLLDHLDDEVILEYASELAAEEPDLQLRE